ncbi:helix-turn-helix transcriptional regulator [Haloferax sp. S1W]|uniref:helix-turn-helix transcriptional regulator n=1 Tax=Haloferax sp. S1W TaxID=3377110 RepID=UPI0037CC9FB7
MVSPREEIEFVARSDHRVKVLDALADQPRNRNELRTATGASSPTVGRVLGDFEDRQWITRAGSAYELTPLGAYVAEQFAALRTAMETEQKLRDVWRWLPHDMEGFSVDLFADAVVSYPGPGYPYQPVERVTHLIEETTELRGFGTTVFKSVNNETVCRKVEAGMEFEYIYSPDVLEKTVAWNPERVARAAACENCTIFLHESLPDGKRCGIGIFDDRIGLCCHDAETGLLEAVVDTDAPEAREWATAVFEQHRTDAHPVTADELGERFSSSRIT